MSQITIYLDPKLESEIRAEAAAQGKSVSSLIGDVLRSRHRGLPPGFWDEIGVIEDFPLSEEIRAVDRPPRRRVDLG